MPKRTTSPSTESVAPPDGGARDEAGPVVDPRLEKEAYRFSFFQAIRLLAAARGGPHTVAGVDPLNEAVRVRPDAANVFPAADVLSLEESDGNQVARMTVGFGGLYGVDASLPESFHGRISTQADDVQPLQDFLDLLSHRPYAQLWKAWARYRPEVRPAARTSDDAHSVRAAALSGFPKNADVPVPRADLLPFAARLSGWSRNAEGLRALLGNALGLPVRIFENVPRWVRLPDRPRLGSGRLGVDMVAGAAIHDTTGKFRVQIGPLGLDAYRSLLPGGTSARRVQDLVRLYISDALDFDVDLLLESSDAPQLRLGDRSSASLGRTAHIGTPPPPVVRRRIRYAPAA